jgi:hypothetical protein
MRTKKNVRHPSNFLFFDTETKDKNKARNTKGEQHRLWFGWVWAFRYENQTVTRSYKKSFETVDGFYEHIQRRIDPSRPLYVVAHNLGFDLTIVDFWERAEQLGMSCLYAVLEDPPLFLSYEWNGCKVVFIDTFNFWKCSVAEMGKSLGIEKLTIDITKCTRKEADPYCQRDVEILANQLINLLDFLTDNDLGSFGISAPAIAMNTFKKRFMTHQIFIHDRERILELERKAYYGGLVNNFFIGKSKGEQLFHTDVNSLYPSVMLERFPVKLLGDYKDITPKKLPKLDQELGFIADVTLQAVNQTFPKRHNNRLCDVQGRFRTQLAGQEYERAYKTGSILHCHELAVYETAPVFRYYVEYFWEMRQRFSQPKGNPKEQLIKLLMNSLYGKFGMKGFDWVDYSREAIQTLYDLHFIPLPKDYVNPNYAPTIQGHVSLWQPMGLNSPVKIRYLAGKLQIQLPTGEHTESFCAIAAFVTSYARERLRSLIRIAGHHNTYYCDTDSLFVTQQGLNNLAQAQELDNKLLGKLKLESTSTRWEFYGPKDYAFGDKIVLKGIKKNAKKLSTGVYQQTQFEGLKSVLNRGGEAYITITTVTKHNKREYNKGLKGHSGWTSPFTLSE